MKKLFFLLSIFLLFFFYTDLSASCVYDGEWDVGAALDGCIGTSTNLVTTGDYSVEGGFKDMVQRWTTAIAGVLGLFAVGAIVYGALLMTLSGGDEEKVSKGKEVVKWAIIWFLGVVTAAGLIAIVVNFIFAIG